MDRITRERLSRVLHADEGVVWAYLFGSAVQGDAYRDVDIAVMLSGRERTAIALGTLQVRLAEAAGTEVDLVDLRAAPLPLIGEILASREVLLDRDPHARHAWEADRALRWLDFRPTYEWASALRRAALERRLGAG